MLNRKKNNKQPLTQEISRSQNSYKKIIYFWLAFGSFFSDMNKQNGWISKR